MSSTHAAERIVEADVCIYGGTSGGVAAAVQAARMGKRAILVEPGKHLGGMTSGGLSAVDIGDPRSIGGIAREYFTALAARFGRTLAWDRDFEKKSGPATGGAFSIEPHAAEQLFDEMVREAGVGVHLDQPLAKVEKHGSRIVGFTTESGTTFRAKMFVDATYEGDLMAAAGVSYTITREGNAKYGEQLNGIHYDPKFAPRTKHGKPGKNGRMPGGQGVWDRDLPLDPYVKPGDPSSGLLPLVDAGEPGIEGEPAPGVQAYCYRLCLTTAADRLPIKPPADYDAGRYELVARFIAACQALGDDIDLRWFSKYDPLPNDKWDFNTATFGGNLPGASWAWPEASYSQRREIAREHENYHRGLLHFLASDSRVPAKVRDEMRRFGLPRDEFTSTGGWPHQIYVREARRMVSDLVLTEHHTYGRQVADKSIGLGSYGTDAHEIRRIVKDGVVAREGKVAGGRDGFGPYQIGYGAIVPKAAECENLLVTFALSASHTAFASIRMEPVLMVTSQSAATAACLAIDAGTSVQQVDYAKLRERLAADQQVIAWAQPAKKSSAETKDAKPQAASLAAIRLAKPVEPAAVDGKSFDLVVIGATPSGVACAVRAAREGCTVLLVQHNRILGGMMANGLMQWDALYGGHRAPLFTELLTRIDDHYRKKFGADSRDRTVARYSQEHYPIGWVESHLAEREFNRLVADERRITLLVEHYPSATERDGSLLRSVTLRKYGGTAEIHVRATSFADATYEGDLAALAKVPYRVGREASDEFKEPHAGKVFTNIAKGPAPKDAVEGRLNIHPYSSKQGSIDPTSPRTADGAVQAYNYRFCVSRDPDNRILPAKPANYNREEYLHYERKSIATNAGPNQKSHVNSPILPGENHDYPEADWPTRERITRRHLEFGLGLMYFLQNDESVSEAKRAEFRKWGLAKDEFTDNDNVPYEMYVREARRIVGRHVYTEHDNSIAPGLGRTPIYADSIAVTDWYMDSHSCTTDSRPGYRYDGKLILTEESRPGQIPYRSLLPQGVDNLVVPVCLSATHIAWGAVRLEPVWMQTGEAAGLAIALAKKERKTLAELDPDLLVQTLAEKRHLVSFFNDVDLADKDDVVPAVQFFGTLGFFHDYNARLDEPLKESTARVWLEGFANLRRGKSDAGELARSVAKAESAEAPAIKAAGFAELLAAPNASDAEPEQLLTRRAALLRMWQLIERN
jgi:NADPH-dependent 2,4-dienoyl-CoA reductase/sulfur reductase-like enzyme